MKQRNTSCALTAIADSLDPTVFVSLIESSRWKQAMYFAPILLSGQYRKRDPRLPFAAALDPDHLPPEFPQLPSRCHTFPCGAISHSLHCQRLSKRRHTLIVRAKVLHIYDLFGETLRVGYSEKEKEAIDVGRLHGFVDKNSERDWSAPVLELFGLGCDRRLDADSRGVARQKHQIEQFSALVVLREVFHWSRSPGGGEGFVILLENT